MADISFTLTSIFISQMEYTGSKLVTYWSLRRATLLIAKDWFETCNKEGLA
ncbi:MAG: hypothetical protein PHY48_06185 [Candidatus Cloacimonetes bacterium]|nr:hypothetical protein [Candidatus Cloacimonadota bacterium]